MSHEAEKLAVKQSADNTDLLQYSRLRTSYLGTHSRNISSPPFETTRLEKSALSPTYCTAGEKQGVFQGKGWLLYMLKITFDGSMTGFSFQRCSCLGPHLCPHLGLTCHMPRSQWDMDSLPWQSGMHAPLWACDYDRINSV